MKEIKTFHANKQTKRKWHLWKTYLIEVEIAVYTQRDEVRQALGCQVLFGDAQLLMSKGALVNS